jgi:hypothetical protein
MMTTIIIALAAILGIGMLLIAMVVGARIAVGGAENGPRK